MIRDGVAAACSTRSVATAVAVPAGPEAVLGLRSKSGKYAPQTSTRSRWPGRIVAATGPRSTAI